MAEIDGWPQSMAGQFFIFFFISEAATLYHPTDHLTRGCGPGPEDTLGVLVKTHRFCTLRRRFLSNCRLPSQLTQADWYSDVHELQKLIHQSMEPVGPRPGWNMKDSKSAYWPRIWKGISPCGHWSSSGSGQRPLGHGDFPDFMPFRTHFCVNGVLIRHGLPSP